MLCGEKVGRVGRLLTLRHKQTTTGKSPPGLEIEIRKGNEAIISTGKPQTHEVVEIEVSQCTSEL